MFSLYLCSAGISRHDGQRDLRGAVGHYEMGGESNVFSRLHVAEFGEIVKICDQVIFNSFAQWDKFRGRARLSGQKLWLRVNPAFDAQSPYHLRSLRGGSRMGGPRLNFRPDFWWASDGLIFTPCACRTRRALRDGRGVRDKFGEFIPRMKWVNFRRRPTSRAKDTHRPLVSACARPEKVLRGGVLATGEAVAMKRVFSFQSVIDEVRNGVDTRLDAPRLPHAGRDRNDYRSAALRSGCGRKGAQVPLGRTRAEGDVIGEYSFDAALVRATGDFRTWRSIPWSKTNTFQRMRFPPSICARELESSGEEFGYDDSGTGSREG